VNNKIFSIGTIFLLSFIAISSAIFISSNSISADNYPYASKYSINVQTWDYSKTWIDVTTSIKSQDWISNHTQECSVTITLNQSDHVERIVIHEVWITIYSEYDESREIYSESKIVSNILTYDELFLEGDKKEYSFKISIDEEHDRLGIAGHVVLAMIDINGQSDIIQIKPFTSTSHPQDLLEISVEKPSDNSAISLFLIYVAVGAIIGGAVGLVAFLVSKKRKDVSSVTQSQSDQNPQVQLQPNYACQTCGKPLTYVNQYQRWYCTNCEKYMN
jgi:hypothetical protein